MLDFPLMFGARRALGIFGLPHDLRILDLDDPAQFVRVGLRPTQIVTRNLAVMQGRAHRIWSEKAPHRSDHTWQAVSWWSFRRLQRLQESLYPKNIDDQHVLATKGHLVAAVMECGSRAGTSPGLL
jgi:hypothetical protein